VVIFSGLFGLLVLGVGAILFLAVLRWLVLVSIAVIFCIGTVSLAIAGIVFFGLYQFFGTKYGPLIIAVSIAFGLMSAVLMLRSIAAEIGIRPSNPLKRTDHAR